MTGCRRSLVASLPATVAEIDRAVTRNVAPNRKAWVLETAQIRIRRRLGVGVAIGLNDDALPVWAIGAMRPAAVPDLHNFAGSCRAQTGKRHRLGSTA